MKNLLLTREFHISRKARDLYRFDESIFSLSGNALFANFRAARLFAQKMNERRDLVAFPEQAVKPGQITAMGLIDEILHYVVGLFREQEGPGLFRDALLELEDGLGSDVVDRALRLFTEEFPPVMVHRREMTVDQYLSGGMAGRSNREIALEEMLLLWLANMNLAFSPFLELFDDTVLRRGSGYLAVIDGLRAFFTRKSPFGPFSQTLVEMLRSPAVASPHSLPGQIEYIREHWGYLLRKFLVRLLGSLDLFREEEKVTFPGPGRAEVYRYGGLGEEPEQFSPDSDWMPNLVLVAKNIYVWLHQLSRRHGRTISRLDEIPSEELDTLQRWGITGLWLIGVWERSPASQRIKQLCGNPEAVPSAYSLYDYEIAQDLGGEGAYAVLKDEAWKRGIRLASDMVPNHMGIDSRWMAQHPDWFVYLPRNPFPWYTWEGPDLSSSEHMSLYIENHYYSRTDAAVVFKRVDRHTGEERFIYHGNDGTSMPWNDTAQLDYLRPEVREGMIRTILHVARKFPVVRFDAAMTLTKRHYQRLWFPEPGSGGAIPTRSEHGLRKEEFDALMPAEFWREVVDRVAAEAPDTLLLAEAFWLLEGYFVRTLGMHRVYNSAFMNMLRDEENAKYRTLMKNTLEFDPQVLRRFVNFMNNPDERTAVDQFGKDGKYFGVCTMMVTMPGLPMIGHGQIEGFAEKYGMEYRRAYWDEEPDRHLIWRHEKEIFPLLKKRYLFAGIDHFLLYDFFLPEGRVNEDVFAYSNRAEGERVLVLYHNRNSRTAGWIRTSAAFSAGEGARGLTTRTLAQGLGLSDDRRLFLVFRDHVSDLEYIRAGSDLAEQGMYVELGPYGYHVFLDFREIEDNEWHHYSHLTSYLNGRGVPRIEEALEELFLQPVYHRFHDLMRVETFAASYHLFAGSAPDRQRADHLILETSERMSRFLFEVKTFSGGTRDHGGLVTAFETSLRRLLLHPFDGDTLSLPGARRALSFITPILTNRQALFYTSLAWLMIHPIGRVLCEGNDAIDQARSWIEDWHLGTIVGELFIDLGMSDTEGSGMVTVAKLLTTHQEWFIDGEDPGAYSIARKLQKDGEVRQFIAVNRYRDVLWFSKEAFEELLAWLLLAAFLTLPAGTGLSEEESDRRLGLLTEAMEELKQAAETAGYQVEHFFRALREQANSR